MRTKEIRYYLHTLDDLRQDIIDLRQALHDYKSMDIKTIKAINYSEERSGNTNVITRTLETIVIDRVTRIEKMENELAYKIMIVRCIDSVIIGLRGSIRDIIYMRYLDKGIGKQTPSFSYISHKLKHNMSYIKRIDSIVVVNIQKRYEDMFL